MEKIFAKRDGQRCTRKGSDVYYMSEQGLHTMPFCIESMYAGIDNSWELFLKISELVEEINSLVQKAQPGLQVEVVNQVDEITKFNVDRNKFYIRVKTND